MTRVAIVTPSMAALGGTESIAQQEFAAIATHAEVTYITPQAEMGNDDRSYAPVRVPRLPGVAATTAWFRAADRAVGKLRPAPDLVYSPGINGTRATHVEVHAIFAQWRDDPAPWALDAREWARRHRYHVLAAWERRVYCNRNVRLATVSAAAAAELARRYDRDDVRVLWPTPDPGRFAPTRRSALRAATRRAYGIAPTKPLLLTLGNAWWSKGFARLFQAMRDPRLRDAELWVISNESRARVARHTGGIPAHVRWLPRTAAVEALYAAADAVLLASRGETFGLPIAEAALMGVPVRVSPHAGVAARLPAACVVNDDEWPDILAALVSDPAAAAPLAEATRAALLTYSPAQRRCDFLDWLGLA